MIWSGKRLNKRREGTTTILRIAGFAAFLLLSLQARVDDRPIKIRWVMSYTGPGAAAGGASDAAIEVFFKNSAEFEEHSETLP